MLRVAPSFRPNDRGVPWSSKTTPSALSTKPVAGSLQCLWHAKLKLGSGNKSPVAFGREGREQARPSGEREWDSVGTVVEGTDWAESRLRGKSQA
jgi:hypothetical protein